MRFIPVYVALMAGRLWAIHGHQVSMCTLSESVSVYKRATTVSVYVCACVYVCKYVHVCMSVCACLGVYA